MGRQLSELVDVYEQNKKQTPSEYKTIDSNIYSSKVVGLTLHEYCIARKHYCKEKHLPYHATQVSPALSTHTSCDCNAMIKAAEIVIQEGIVTLSSVFKAVFPNVTYQSHNAKSRLLAMPVVAICLIGELYLLEKNDNFDYSALLRFFNKQLSQSTAKSGISRNELKQLLSIAQSERERECVKYAVYKASSITPSQARRQFGLENMKMRALHVEECIQKAQEIREAVEELAADQDKAMLDAFGACGTELGILEHEDFSSEGSDIDASDMIEQSTSALPDDACLIDLLRSSEFNWFNFVDRVENSDSDMDGGLLNEFFLRLPKMELTETSLHKTVQSHRAFMAARRDTYEQDKLARSVNGEIVTESESSCDELANETKQLIIKRKRLSIKRRARRLKTRLLAEQRFLQRRLTKKTSKILTECPNIGHVVEEFVKDHNVGADAWRRTGVLTFDGNAKLPSKVTYKKIQCHLEKIFGRKFAYGTVVELCIPRNRRHKSAKRYQGLAKVTSRRARKGFNLRYNPDAHWSSALYKALNQLQYVDGANLLNINRDDAAGFRLDTITTCKQYTNPTVQGCDVLTTRTDYVNKYPSLLQTTSYNFSGTRLTAEVCVGVKAVPLHKKNPAQHYSDLLMLSQKECLGPVFLRQTGQPKDVDCIRVDGASDEGPGHEIVQYWWTKWHIDQAKIATLLTTRCSGSSYLNKVELQNGCLSLGHSNTFIPSTLSGPCYDSETGKINEDKLKENINLAIDAYISRVDGTPCGDTNIRLFKGSNSELYQDISSSLEVFLKGPAKKQVELQASQPALYEEFKRVWDIRDRHMIKGLPQSYIFFLRCCCQPECSHPRCRSIGSLNGYTWYPSGPPITHLPFVIPDSDRPWGNPACCECKNFCAGHYSTIIVDTSQQKSLDKLMMPPSLILKKKFSKKSISDDFLEETAKTVLLTKEEVGIWFNHLSEIAKNRRRGAIKAARTRQLKKLARKKVESGQQRQEQKQVSEKYESNYCGNCGIHYEESLDFWVACDVCDRWYCSTCEGLSTEPEESEKYICKQCV